MRRSGLIAALSSILLWATVSTPKRAAAAEQAPAPAPAARLVLDSRPLRLGRALQTVQPWLAYKERFITDRGRVLDTGNGSISHSEGQGYAMLLAVAAGDRPTFERVWGWTRANMMVRDDRLIAWRWEPAARPAVADMNNATDGDILVAWALTEAGDLWGDPAHKVAARRIATDVARKLVLFKTRLGAVLLPAATGFQVESRADGPIVNLSYYVFPAFARLGLVAPEVDWDALTQGGLDLLDATRVTPQSLPADWLALEGGRVRPADGFAPLFSFDAVRVPLYLAWAGVGGREHYAPFVAWAKRSHGAPAIVDVASGRDAGAFAGSGFTAIAALVICAAEGAGRPANVAAGHANEDYYPATLRLLAAIAAQMRYPSCVAQ